MGQPEPSLVSHENESIRTVPRDSYGSGSQYFLVDLGGGVAAASVVTGGLAHDHHVSGVAVVGEFVVLALLGYLESKVMEFHTHGAGHVLVALEKGLDSMSALFHQMFRGIVVEYIPEEICSACAGLCI